MAVTYLCVQILGQNQANGGPSVNAWVLCTGAGQSWVIQVLEDLLYPPSSLLINCHFISLDMSQVIVLRALVKLGCLFPCMFSKWSPGLVNGILAWMSSILFHLKTPSFSEVFEMTAFFFKIHLHDMSQLDLQLV